VDTVRDDNLKSDLRRRKKVSVFNCLRKLWAAWKACFFQSGFPGCRNWRFFLSFRFFDLEFESLGVELWAQFELELENESRWKCRSWSCNRHKMKLPSAFRLSKSRRMSIASTKVSVGKFMRSKQFCSIWCSWFSSVCWTCFQQAWLKFGFWQCCLWSSWWTWWRNPFVDCRLLLMKTCLMMIYKCLHC
jgi:hypothetical protein